MLEGGGVAVGLIIEQHLMLDHDVYFNCFNVLALLVNGGLNTFTLSFQIWFDETFKLVCSRQIKDLFIILFDCSL